MKTPAWIGLGSNLGDREALLDAAVEALRGIPGVVVRAVSDYHETRPVGGPPGQGAFLNAACHLDTTLDPYQLLAVLREIEDQGGRVRDVRWDERTLDLDLLIFGTRFLDTNDLKLPHPRLAFRRFVLAPLAEIAPNLVDIMTRRTIDDLLSNLDRRPRLLVLDGDAGPMKSTLFRRLVDELPAFGIAEEELGPPSAGGDDPLAHFIENLGRKAEAIRAGRWVDVILRTPWIVADYCLGSDILRSSPGTWLAGLPPSEWAPRRRAYYRGIKQAVDSAKAALRPTMAVILPGGARMDRRPGMAKVPRLRPESDNPDAIVAEVLATCRGISEV